MAPIWLIGDGLTGKIVKIGDLVKYTPAASGLEFSPHAGRTGLILRVDKDFYGARQAFKRYNWIRGQCINTLEADGYGPTKDGIRDRILVMWGADNHFEYIESIDLEVVSEDR